LFVFLFQGSEWYSSSLTASDRLKLMFENQKKLDQTNSAAEKEALLSNKQGE
jgi:hypothetical protein